MGTDPSDALDVRVSLNWIHRVSPLENTSKVTEEGITVWRAALDHKIDEVALRLACRNLGTPSGLPASPCGTVQGRECHPFIEQHDTKTKCQLLTET